MPPSEVSARFHFRAGAPDGGVFAGEMSAPSAEAALQELRRHGYRPLRIASHPIRSSILDREIGPGSRKHLSPAECDALCRELALMLGSGISVADAVRVMAPSLPKGSRLHRFTTALGHGLRLGRSLAAAMEGTGFEFPPDFLPVVRAGEEAGSLGPALTLLAESYEESIRFTRTWTGALIYPALLLAVAMMVLVLIAFFVAPSLAGLFASMDRPVPFAIGTLASVAAFGSANLFLCSAALTVACSALAVTLAQPRVRQALRALAFRIPVLGTALSWSASRRFAAMLRLYALNNVPMGTALPRALAAAGFPGGRTRALVESVRAGGRLTAALEAARLMPPKIVRLIRVGETSSRLADVLKAVAEEARIRFEQRMTMLTALLAPLLILLVGSLIGGIVFSVFTALLDVNDMAM